jgi:hypothetical protein
VTDAHVIPALTNSSLVSIGQLCDASCKAIFDATQVIITHKNQLIISGQRDKRTGLWQLPLKPIEVQPMTFENTYHTCNSAYTMDTMPELIKFLHATAFSPTKATWLKATKHNFFQSWLGLTEKRSNDTTPNPLQHQKDTWIRHEPTFDPHDEP